MATKMTKGTGFVPDYHVPTPSLLVNKHLIGGGFPAGSIVQIQSAGPGSFKTSFAIATMGNAQAMGHDIAYVDAEGALNNYIDDDGRMRNDWLEAKGVKPWEMYYVGPGPGEEIWEQIHDLINNYNVKFIVLDSIHATQATKIHDDEMGSHHIGLHAKLHTVALIKSIPILRNNQAILVGINHLKANMTPQGVMGKKATGGEAWYFYSQHVLVNTRSNSKSKNEGKDLIPIEVYIDKNKGGKQFVKIDTFADQMTGFSQEAELVELAIEGGLVIKKGGWYRDFNNEVIGQGIETVAQWAKENKELILS